MANEHTGHRDRVRKKFLENGFDGFEPHEVLEMCLYIVTEFDYVSLRESEMSGSIFLL